MDTVSIFRLSHLSKLHFWMLLYGPPAHTSVVFQCNHMLTILKLCENLLPGKSCSTSRTVPQCAFVSALCMACLSPEVNTNRTQYETLDMNHNSYVCLTYPSDKIKTKQSHIVHCRDRPREIKPPFVMFSYVVTTGYRGSNLKHCYQRYSRMWWYVRVILYSAIIAQEPVATLYNKAHNTVSCY